MNSTSIEEMVQKYTDSITAGNFHIPTGRCRNCRQKMGSSLLLTHEVDNQACIRPIYA